MNMTLIKSAGALFTGIAALDRVNATAGGSGDATAANGLWIDRRNTDGRYESGKLIITYKTTLAASQTLSFAVKVQDAVDGSGTGAADYENAIGATIVRTGAVTNGIGTVEVDLENLSGAREFLRFVVTPDLSAANTDTVEFFGTFVAASADRSPISKSIGSIGRVLP